jgi:ferritin-like metal-binding protein YciE
MSLGSLKDLYLEELSDLYDSEEQKTVTLPRLAEAAHAPELREALVKQCRDVHLRLERLQLIFTHWGVARRTRHCAGLAGIVQEADERLNEPATHVARDAAVFGAAHRIARYEMAAYEAARLYARWLNRLDDARLLEETLEEETRADRKLTDIADARISASGVDLSAA